MRIQLWSYNFDPEPQGIGPLSGTLARGLLDRGHDVLVVAAHPHYPEPVWGKRFRPYQERQRGVRTLRLPLWAGRESGFARIRQELSFTLAQSLAAPLLPTPDIVVAVSPSFPALAPAMAFTRIRNIPWVMWLQDMVTDGAATTGILPEGHALRAARAFERATYGSANRVVVISDVFRRVLLSQGVSPAKIERIFNPTSREVAAPNDIGRLSDSPPRILCMGNIGRSQGLEHIVAAFEESEALEHLGCRLAIVGSGVAKARVRDQIASMRVDMPGLLHGPDLEPQLRSASLALVSQRADVDEFNLPSKLMNYMAYGIPVIASVRRDSETAAIVRQSQAGWVTDAADPAAFARKASELLGDVEALKRAGLAGFRFAQQHFASRAVAEKFEAVLLGSLGAPTETTLQRRPRSRQLG